MILVVEDDEAVREVSVEMLRDLGYCTLVARSGQEAFDLLKTQEPIDLLFTDMVMPGGFSGAELARRAQVLRPGIRVLLTIGYASGSGTEAAEFSLIAKPFRAADLSFAIANLMNPVPRTDDD